MCVNREGIVKVYLTTIRPILEYGVQAWLDIPEFISNKLESIKKRALHIIYHAIVTQMPLILTTLAA